MARGLTNVRQRLRARCDDRGSAIATVPLIGATMTLFLLVVHIAFWFYGRMAITSAAQHGLDVARVAQHDNPTAAEVAGEQVVDEFLGQIGGVQEDYERVVDVEDDEVTVTIRAEPPRVVRGFPAPSMSVEVTASIEQVVD